MEPDKVTWPIIGIWQGGHRPPIPGRWAVPTLHNLLPKWYKPKCSGVDHSDSFTQSPFARPIVTLIT